MEKSIYAPKPERLDNGLRAPTYVPLTDVDAEPEGDVILPPLDPAIWKEVSAKAYFAGEGDDHGFVIRVLERR